tara:strand:+ start:379 stop:570 length:192 start_codon:yes stop_codon:yes gene_type:complete
MKAKYPKTTGLWGLNYTLLILFSKIYINCWKCVKYELYNFAVIMFNNTQNIRGYIIFNSKIAG